MTDKFISPCSQPEPLKEINKTSHDKALDDYMAGSAYLDTTYRIPTDDEYELAKDAFNTGWKASIEAFGNPTDDVLEALASTFHGRLMPETPWDQLPAFIQSGIRLVAQNALRAAINQTLKEGE